MSDDNKTKDESRELSREYWAWENDPKDCGFGPAVEEAWRLAKVIVGLRARIAELEGARAKAFEEAIMVADMWRDPTGRPDVVLTAEAISNEINRRMVISAPAPAVAQAEAQDDKHDGCGHYFTGTWHESKLLRPGHRLQRCILCDCIGWDDGTITENGDVRRLAAQPSGEVQPCTGAEFVAAAQSAIEPRSDEEIYDAIASTEGKDQ